MTAHLDIPSDAALDIIGRLLPGFAPPEKLTPSQWAERNLSLPKSSNAEPGPLVLTSYQRGMVDAMADPDVRVAVLKLASQTGKSLAIDCTLAHLMVTDPGPMLAVHPTDGKAKAYVVDRLNPLIAASLVLRGIIGTGGRGRAGDSNHHKAFPGGSLNVASSHKPDDLAARSIRYLLCDELDRFAMSAGQEGSPELLAFKRLHTFRTRSKTILASTPTVSGSRIEGWYRRGDQRRFACPCPECGGLQAFGLDHLKWEPGRPDTAHLTCEHCAHAISEAERLAAVELGRWVATAQGEPGIRSFHATEIISKFSSLEHVAQQAEDAETTPEKRRVFVNTSLAETFEDEGVALDAETLRTRAVPLRAPYPAEIAFVTAGVDVQADRVEVTFLGSMRAGVQAVLNHRKIPGDTSGSAVWDTLDAALGETFPLADGRRVSVAVTAIDAGYQTSAVVDFVMRQRAQARQCFAVKGVSGFDKPDVKMGGKFKGLVSGVLVGVDMLKVNLQRRLSMSTIGPGFLYLPDHLGPEYFDGLAAEKLVTRYVRGFARKEWHMAARSGGGNEPLDCLAYAAAISKLVTRPAAGAPAAQTDVATMAAELHALSNGAK